MMVRYGDRLSWCYEGQHVIAPCQLQGRQVGLVCTVAKACGVQALVVNDRWGLERWYDVCDLHQALFDPTPPFGDRLAA